MFITMNSTRENSRMKIGIVADTSSNFTPELAETLGIHIVPMQIMIDEMTYQDAIDLTIDEFYEKWKNQSNYRKHLNQL